MMQMKQETRDGMQIEWDMPILMSDGLTLRADVFRPIGEGQFPIIMSYGPMRKAYIFKKAIKAIGRD